MVTLSTFILWAISAVLIYLIGWVNGAISERNFMLSLAETEDPFFEHHEPPSQPGIPQP